MRHEGTIIVFLALLLAGGLFLAGLFGQLPDSLQVRFAETIGSFSGSPAPYLQKFEGRWQLTLGDGGSAQGLDCSGGQAIVAVHNGAFAARLDLPGKTRNIQGAIAWDGALQGTIAAGPQSGSIKGAVSGVVGQGSWKDVFDCSGTVTLAKLDPVVDPAIGRVVSFGGSLTLVRGDGSQGAYADELLYVGDRLTAGGGDATLSFGLYPPKVVTVPSGTTYTVPDKP